MNKIGRLFQLSLFGESHGECVGCLIDGCLPGIHLTSEDFTSDLMRRKSGCIGTTPRVEADEVIIKSGVFKGYTTGAPILIEFKNENINSNDYKEFLDTPRPSHADYTARIKYNGFNDYRGGGHFSGRLTLGVVCGGVIAKKILKDASFSTKIINLNGETNEAMFTDILRNARDMGDSVGGILEIKVKGIECGLGEPYFDSLESTISHALFSIGGVKGVEFGAGFSAVGLRGSEFNDRIIDKEGHTATNNNGGINGGISNGNELIIRVFIKPTPTISIPQEVYSFNTDSIKTLSSKGRHDSAIILRAAVACEAAVAISLCDAYLINKAYK